MPSDRRIRLKTSRLLLASDEKKQKLLQAAAVCYRWSSNTIEFLLVRTRGGRWTFPKGGLVPGYTSAESAALEAMEEAGVHGRIERTPFARYRARKHAKEKSSSVELTVQAHLCEVLTLCPPEEAGRRPTWFYRESAKERLREDRVPMDAAELERVVNQAASRIQRLRSQFQAEPLQKSHFEVSSKPDIQVLRKSATNGHAMPSPHPCAKYLLLSTQQSRVLKLVIGSKDTMRAKVQSSAPQFSIRNLKRLPPPREEGPR